MPFIDANTAAGLPKSAPFQIGRSDVDPNTPIIEQDVSIPWNSDPAGSYVYYDCTVGMMLDSGMVIHNRLPQVNNTPDTLSSIALDDPNLETITAQGVNLKCQDQYKDIIQRMGHSRYWFRLWGQALRVGYQVPIPSIKMIGGVPAVPYDQNPQWAFNRIAPGGNYSGIILWHAMWSLWYTTLVPPVNNTFPAADPSAHITGTTTIPDGIQSPYSAPDDNAQVASPLGPQRAGPVGTTSR